MWWMSIATVGVSGAVAARAAGRRRIDRSGSPGGAAGRLSVSAVGSHPLCACWTVISYLSHGCFSCLGHADSEA